MFAVDFPSRDADMKCMLSERDMRSLRYFPERSSSVRLV